MTIWTRIQQFFSDSVFMIPLGLCSFVALAVILQRLLVVRRNAVMPPELVRALSDAQADTETLRQAAHRTSSPLARVTRAALRNLHRDRGTAADATQATAREEFVHLQNGLSTLEVIITIAPLLGLLGTVSGLVSVFSNLSSPSTETAANTLGVARGISEALNTTIAGLAIAVPTVIAHSYFNKKIERMSARMEVLLQNVVHRAFS